MALFGGGPDNFMATSVLRQIPSAHVGLKPAAGRPSVTPPTPQTYQVGPTAVRASGGAFDSGYNQALAGYGASAGQLAPAHGNLLSFNPTSTDPFAGLGQKVGAGNAPLTGLPNTWLQNGAFRAPAYSQPVHASGNPAQHVSPFPQINDWLKQWSLRGFGGRERL